MKFRILAVAGVMAVSATGCDSLLDTAPKQSLTPEQTLGTFSLYRNLLAGAYNRLQSEALYGQRQILAPEALADNAILANNTGRYTTEVINNRGTGVGGWATWYAIINDVNFVIEGIDQVNGPEATKRQLKAEAYFLRGFSYFNLARIYSYEPGVGSFDLGVVIRTTPTRLVEDAVPQPRATRAETYAQIFSDLNMARSEFLASGVTAGVSVGSLAGTEALLSRVHLYARDWANAEALATAAFASAAARGNVPRLTTQANHIAAFVPAQAGGVNPESFFEVVITNTTTEGLAGNGSLQSLTVPVAGGFYSLRPSPEFLATLEAGDVRRGFIVATTGSNPGPAYSKYRGSLGNYADNIPVIRYAEVLLNRAEARAEQSNIAGALADLNQLRAARGATPSVAATPAALVEDILLERRRELAFEGHRWFDIKRRGLDLVKPAATGVGTITADDIRFLAPIPTDQPQLSGGVIAQNPGY